MDTYSPCCQEQNSNFARGVFLTGRKTVSVAKPKNCLQDSGVAVGGRCDVGSRVYYMGPVLDPRFTKREEKAERGKHARA